MSLDAHDLERHRPAITGHCYRMLGSAAEAEDAAQDTFVRAWQHLARFEGRSSLRTWLYRIATNVCLDALADRSRRWRPIEIGSAGTTEDDLVARPGGDWLEPVPDARVIAAEADPFERAAERQRIRLAFVAALQHLPPRQRAALLLADVVGSSAAEIAECLDMSVAAVNSALQRARATLAARHPSSHAPAAAADADLSDEERALLGRYVDAFHRYDVDAWCRCSETMRSSRCRLHAVAGGARARARVAVGPRHRLPGVAPGADRGLRPAGVRAVSARRDG